MRKNAEDFPSYCLNHFGIAPNTEQNQEIFEFEIGSFFEYEGETWKRILEEDVWSISKGSYIVKQGGVQPFIVKVMVMPGMTIVKRINQDESLDKAKWTGLKVLACHQ